MPRPHMCHAVGLQVNQVPSGCASELPGMLADLAATYSPGLQFCYELYIIVHNQYQ